MKGEGKWSALQVDFDGQIRLEFHGANVTSDAGLLAYRELDEALGLTAGVEELGIHDPRTGQNTRHTVTAMDGSRSTAVWPVTKTPKMRNACVSILPCDVSSVDEQPGRRLLPAVRLVASRRRF